MKILVVDDDPIAAELVSATLSEFGFTNVTAAHSGIDALKILESSQNPFDCFLLDLRMPNMDGIKLCTRIRQYETYRNAPVIFITAVSDRADITSAYAAGAVDYVTKPIDPMEVGIRVSVAEKLVLEERARKEANRQAERMRRQLDDVLNFTPGEAVEIVDVPKVISKMAMQNYLATLSRPKLQHTQVIAFAINEFRTLFRKAHPSEFYFLLADTAKVMSKSLNHTDRLISYYGNGEFICVSERDAPFFDEDLAGFMNKAIADLDLAFEDGTPVHLTLSVGEPAKLTMWDKPDPEALVKTALDSVSSIRRGFRSAEPGDTAGRTYRSPLLNM